jgi:hypothetical protein
MNTEQSDSDKPKAPITVEALDLLAEKMKKQQAVIDAANAALKIQKDAMTKMEIQAKAYLEELNRTEFMTPHGELKIKEHWTIKMPEDEDKKLELFEWMKGQGIYERYATVHATSLKTLVKKERQDAVKRGEDMMLWALPGMDVPKLYTELDFKPAKEE